MGNLAVDRVTCTHVIKLSLSLSEVGVAQDQIDEADDSKEDLIDLILAVVCKENGKTPAQLKETQPARVDFHTLAQNSTLSTVKTMLIAGSNDSGAQLKQGPF